MPVSINHQTSSYLPVTSPSKSGYRHHCSSNYKSSYSTLSDKYSYPSSRYSSYSRTSSLSDDSGLSITGTSCTRDRSTDSTDSTLSRYSSKARSSSSSDTSGLKSSYTSSTLSRKTPSSRYLTDIGDISVADIRLRFSSLPKTDASRASKLSETRSYTRSESLQPLALSSHRKSALATTLESSPGSCEEDRSSLRTSSSSNLCRSSSSLSTSAASSSLSTSASAATPLPPGAGRNGLRNIGNTCFLNSVVQCLSNTPLLKEYLVSGAFKSDINCDSQGSLIKYDGVAAFADIVKELWLGDTRVLNPTVFKNQIQHFAPRFMGCHQQDAQEFLRYLLEGLHEDLNRVKVKPRDLSQIDENLSEQQKAAECWKRYIRCDNSKIVDLFVGQLKSALRCTYCNHSSTTYEVFWDLSLPLPAKHANSHLLQCLEFFTKRETLDGDEMPTCSNCKVRRKCTKAFTIQKLPPILVLHLKRFSHERYRKLLSSIDFPLNNLDMTPYLDAEANVETPLYTLYAVSNHSGSTQSGHYTAYCRNLQTDTWYHFNDTRVTPIATRHIVSSEAYLLFYIQNGQFNV